MLPVSDSIAISPRNLEITTTPKMEPKMEMGCSSKTNELASRFFLGLGLAVAGVSFVAAILVSSSYLAGVAAGACMIGLSILVDESSNVQRVGSTNFIDGQPVGIENASMNCWANSLLQFMRSVPSLFKHAQNFEVLQSFYNEYDQAAGARQTVAANANSQSVREWFSGRTGISPFSFYQEDPSDALNHLLASFPPHNMELRRVTNEHGEQVVRNQDARAFLINLQNHNNRPLDRLFVENCLWGNQETLRFHTKPQELLFHLNRNEQWPSRGKIDDALNIPGRIALPSRSVMTGQGGNYDCDAFISHLGSSMDTGHYVAYVLRNGKWWLCDDSSVTPVNMAQVDEARRKAYILHYKSI